MVPDKQTKKEMREREFYTQWSNFFLPPLVCLMLIAAVAFNEGPAINSACKGSSVLSTWTVVLRNEWLGWR